MEAQTAISLGESMGFNLVQHKDLKLWMLIFNDVTMYMKPNALEQTDVESFKDYLKQFQFSYEQWEQSYGPQRLH